MTLPHETTTEALASLGWRHERGRLHGKQRIICAATGQAIGEMTCFEANDFVAEIRSHLVPA